MTARQVTVVSRSRTHVIQLSAEEWNALTDMSHFNRQESLTPMERVCREIEKAFPGHRRLSIALSHQIAPIWQLEAPPVFLNWSETQGWAHEALRNKIGPLADQWKVRAEWSAQDSTVIASSIPDEWLDALLGVFKRNKMHIVRVQPWVTAFCANEKKLLKKSDTWLALVEAGRICLARVNHGHLQRVRVESFADSAVSALHNMLHRAALTDSAPPSKNLIVQAHGVEEDWKMLKPYQLTLIPVKPGQSSTPSPVHSASA
jgi:hypothetical protein